MENIIWNCNGNFHTEKENPVICTRGLVQIVVRTLLWSFTKIKNTIGNGLIMQVPKKPAIDLYKMHANHTERYCTVSWSLEVSIPSINVFKACCLIKQTSPDIDVIAK